MFPNGRKLVLADRFGPCPIYAALAEQAEQSWLTRRRQPTELTQ